MKNIYLIAGKSGTGKDTIVNELCNLYGYKRVTSYTTRRPREDDNDTYSHEFVDMDSYRWDKECGQIMAETFYNGNYYWATTHQIDENDLYIVDIRGIETIKDRYRGKGIVVIGIEATDDLRVLRMKTRGDSLTSIAVRMETDRESFKELGAVADYMVQNNSNDTGTIQIIASRINNIIQLEESKAESHPIANKLQPDPPEPCDEHRSETEDCVCPFMRPMRRDKSEALTGIMQALQGYGDESMVPISRRLLCEVADILQNRI